MVKLSSGESQISLDFNLDTTLFRIFFLRTLSVFFLLYEKLYVPATIHVAEVLPELWWHPDLKSDTCLQPVLIALQISLLFCFFPVKENIIRVISPSKGAISLFWVKNSMNLKTKRKKERKKIRFSFMVSCKRVIP